MLAASLGSGKNTPLKILSLGAHSDDIEIGCGGTLLRLLEERPGSFVCWVVFSAAGGREAEARSSAAAFLEKAGDHKVVIKQFRESYFPYVAAEIKDFFEELKAMINPDLVLCHRRHDEHQDHRTLAQLTWNTFRNHLIAEYEIPKYEGDLATPNMYVPLSKSQADAKVQMIQRYFASQANRTWFRPETFYGLMAVRGVECNAAEGWAEGFHVRKLVV